jgi:hypothetical protein
MPRGSKPGERRGGRKRGTPNKKTLLKNAVFLAAAAEPNRSPLDFMLALMRDPQVSLDLRIKMAAQAAPYVHARPESARNKRLGPFDLGDRPGETADLKFGIVETKSKAGEDAGLSPLDFLLGVMADPAASPRQRVKAAAVAARYKHAPVAAEPEPTPTVIVVEDKFGFKVDPELARAERSDLRSSKFLHQSWFRREKGSDEEKAANEELAQIRKRRAERLALLQYPSGYTVDDFAKDRKRLEQLNKMEQKKLTPKEDAEEAHLSARVAAYQLNPELLGKARIRELEQRRAIGLQLTAAEEQELSDLRARYPELAAEIDQLDLEYMYYFDRELGIAMKAGLSMKAAIEQARVICQRFRDHSKFTSEREARVFARGRTTGAGTREP